MTLDELKSIVPHAGHRAGIFLHALNDAMDEFGIDTPLRQSAFVAQLAHESGSFRYVKELASGEAYEFRKDLGNTIAGEGVRYKGRGCIQVTGRANYASCSEALFGDPNILLANPEMLETVSGACNSAAWFWKTRGLNELADAGAFSKITRRINGGTNGADERNAFYAKAKQVMGC